MLWMAPVPHFGFKALLAGPDRGSRSAPPTAAVVLRHSAGLVAGAWPARAHISASGPIEIPTARTMNTSSHPAGLCGPPAESRATPVPHAPAADKPKPTVE